MRIFAHFARRMTLVLAITVSFSRTVFFKNISTESCYFGAHAIIRVILPKPTQPKKAGNSRQYQGVIYVNDSVEEKAANDFLESNKNAVAFLEPMFKSFYSAEPYHQN